MECRKGYNAIDYFRIIAAVLVVAVHTAPLEDISGTADFILCGIIARLAVPFFFMTSGFFLFKGGAEDNRRLAAFIKRTAVLYGGAVLLYLPVNIYNGYFNQEKPVLNILKDIVFNGTMYHLWYLPAAITGSLIAWFLVKKTGTGRTLAVSLLLYAVGLFGDGYYGVIEGVPAIKHLYDGMFCLFDYTRNGIFLAPVFFVMGAAVSGHKKLPVKFCLPGFIICLTGMIGEGLFISSRNWQRHTSMYVMLVPCMFFLFSALCGIRGKRKLILSRAAMIIYIIHPAAIVAVRLMAKLLHAEEWFVENSLIHFVTVLILSAGAAMGILYIIQLKKVQAAFNKAAETDRAWMEIDLENLKHNVKQLQEIMPEGCRLMAVVKADAYGHGAVRVSGCLNKAGICNFAVATIDEGIELRRKRVKGRILVLGHTDISRAAQLRGRGLVQTITDLEYARQLNACGMDIETEIKLDTGMHRSGLNAEDIESIIKIFSLKHIKVTGIYSHLCAADSHGKEDVEFTRRQISLYFDVLEVLKERGISVPGTHIQSSYGLLNYPEIKCDYARIGIAMYGVLSSKSDSTRVCVDLRPVMAVKARIVQIRNIKAGETVGYGRTFLAGKDSRIAVISIGYADGIPRELSGGNEYVIIHGKRALVIGRICMDVMEADITEIEEAAVGDTVTVIGKDGEEFISAEDMAAGAGTITNELLSRMGKRLKKRYI